MKKLIPLLFLLVSFTITSQNYNYGKISKEDFSISANSEDDAIILYKNRKTNFDYNSDDGWFVETEIHQRIKINTKNGFDWGTHSRLLLKSDGNEEEEMNVIKGATYNLVGGKVERTKLKGKSIFKENVNDYRNKVSLTFPEVKEGSIIEFQYTIKSPFFNIRDIQVQYSIPVKKMEARVYIPEYFVFSQFQKGYHPSQLERTVKSRKINIVRRESVTGGAQTEVVKSSLEFEENRYSVSVSDVPALKGEEYVNNINNYRASYVFELAQYKPTNGQLQNFALNWEDVVRTISQSSRFGIELKKTGYFEKDIDALIASISDPNQKALAIYNYVKSKVKWNNYYGKYTSDGVRRAYKDQVGNVSEINLMLTSMLRYAGLNANPVLISTRSNGVPLFPTLDGYNYVVCGIESDNGVVLLDATNKYSTLNILPFRALNWEGRLVRDDGTSSLINLYPKQASQKTVSAMVKLDASGNIEGSQRTIKTNHEAMLYRENYVNTDKDNYLEKFENSLDEVEISGFEVKNELDLAKPVMETYNFKSESQSDIVADKMYVTPLFFLAEKENPLKMEARDFPVDFGFPYIDKYRINITLPQGYEIESVPESAAFTLPDNIGSFKYVISKNSNGVQVLMDLAINQAIISAEYYDTLKEFYKQAISKQAEQIVLKKI